MRSKTGPALLAVATWLLSLGLALAWAQGHGHGHDQAGSAPVGFAAQMHLDMQRMVKDMEDAPMTGDPDRDFLAMMIPHHQGAVDMARQVLIHGRDPLVRRLAEEIIAGQMVEIQAMRQRLAILSVRPDLEPDGFPALEGTRGPAQE
jgi:hypothetical protein